MCGRELEPEGDLVEEVVQEPVSARPAPAHAEAPRPVTSAPPALPTPPTTPAPAYTGGIFNLGAPAEQKSRSLDYLLEDDEPRSHKGLFLGFVALVLVLGLGYMRFRQTGIPGFRISSPSSTQPASNNAPSATANTPENSAATPAPPAPSTQDQAPATQPPASGTTPPAAAPAAATPTTTAPPASTPPPATPAPAAPAPDSAGASAPGGQDGSNASTPPAASQAQAPTATQAPVPKPEAGQEKPADQEAPSSAVPAAAAPEVPAAPKPAKKPATKPPAAKAEDSVALGEKYLYGRGVPQSCERGLHYVKPAADQSNPKAMITMGALYATGHCLSRDLPTAYRYFALALRQDPENSALKQNTEMVWGQMTQSERQLAIRLTQ